ncbi:E3 ubiquitin ligase family protein [Saccharomonospora glauca]|uniref:RING-type E3 ubiquitin transferase n=1 Tax=Saccharomonospora glauca K62 TaxID=928724 RepID=I1CXR6_9PSEU|nr:E3 ubiquitin ligase family protein [Saccharomonospora glauca]EIE97490.1 E3 Ubiquitin ligase [Saccharomonospora glauca K62]
MWIAGVVLLVVAVAAFFYMKHTRDELHAMIGTETFSIPELERYRAASDELGGKGAFRKTAEVVGAAHPRPEGPLTAELSKVECVWYRYRIDRHYEVIEYRDGKRYRRKRTERVAEHTSHEGYALIDDEGRTIGVDPNGTNPDGVEQTVSRFEPHRGQQGSIELFGIKLPALFGRGDSTIGYDYKEWVIRPGQRLYILGEVHDRIGPLVIGKPREKGHFIISTRTEEELRQLRVRRHKFLAIGTVASTVVGLGLIVADLFV